MTGLQDLRTTPLWLPAAVLASLWCWGNGRPEVGGLFPAPLDKLAHLAAFTILSALLALGLGRCHCSLGFLLVVSFAVLDELRQATLPGRQASCGDWGIDVLAAAFVFPPRVRMQKEALVTTARS